MSPVGIFLQVFLMAALPLAHTALGLRVGNALFRRFGTEGAVSIPAAFLLGLSLHLLLATIVTSLLPTFGKAVPMLPLVALMVFLLAPPSELRKLKTIPVRFDATSLLWFAVVVFLGLNLFDVDDGITTRWLSNYGDLPMHIGMITSFVFGENLPSEHFLLPGFPLSYPLFVNLWTALLWWPHPSFDVLPLIFCYQWTLLWCCVWAAFPRRNLVFPFAVLFAGGSYDVIWKAVYGADSLIADLFGNTMKADKFAWTPLLASVWVPQRSALYGVAVLMNAFVLFDSVGRRTAPTLGPLIFCGLLLSLSVLGHGHFALVGAAYISLVLLLRLICANSNSGRREASRPLLLFLVSLVPVLLSLPFIRGKSSIFSVVSGWLPWTFVDSPGFVASFINPSLTWLHFGIFVVPYIGFAWLFTRAKLELFVLTVLFVTCNLIQLAYWEWDQIKVFAPLMVLFVLLLAWRTPWPQSPLRRALAPLLFLPMFLPGLIDFARIFSSAEHFQMFSAEDLAIAEEIRQVTAPCGVILAKTDHDSPVMLSGRRIYIGYPGWIWSQGYSNHKRMKLSRLPLQRAIDRVANDSSLRAECPRYLLWTDRERGIWGNDSTQAPSLPQVSPHLFYIR